MYALSRYKCLLLLPVLALLLGGCYDDTLEAPYPGEYPEGETEVGFSIDFEPYETQSVSTRSNPGDVLDNIDDLCVVAYDLEGNLMDGFPVEISAAHGLEITSVPRKNSDASNGNSAQSFTLRATFRMKVPYGRYYMYGVANLGRRDDSGNRLTTTIRELSPGGSYAAHVATRESFLKADMMWDETNYRNNAQMMGYFTVGEEKKSPSTSLQTNNKTVSVDRPGITLHSWLRRCASKITLDFDGSGLRDNINIYIKRVTLHDIPDRCALGMPNAADSDDPSLPQLLTYKGGDNRPDGRGDHIDYGHGADYNMWPYISKGSPKLKDSNGNDVDFHSETADAMYLYENMQGETEDDKTNKEQHPTSGGLVVGADENKDNVKDGSYIEVEAYYSHVSSTMVSKGKIIYRFMLGKDERNNFDVERNHHYKITMCPRGNGNDVDWHIEYKEDPGFEFKDPYYVSYLYNHDSTLRFRYKPVHGEEIASIDAEIVGNNWWPDNASHASDVAAVHNPLDVANNEHLDPLNASFTRNRFVDGNGISRTRYLGNGFLSLRATNATVLNIEDMAAGYSAQTWESNGFTKYDNGRYMNDNYFYGFVNDFSNTADKNKMDHSRRTYYFDGVPDATNTGREAYNVEKLPDGSLRFNLPMFTRAKNLVKSSAYTGNNPYESSSRTAYVRITVHFKGGGSDSQILRVEQVPRIMNPKGIYRRSGNNENFEVILTEQTSDNGDEFRAFESDGSWMAEVIGDENFINLNGRSTIKGASGSLIKFNVRFNKMNRDDKVRNAVIRVRYHNYSCVHLIYVRQGYSSQAIEPSGVEWHTTNMVYDGVEGEDPRDEGSLFKFGNLTDPIDVINNIYTTAGVAPALMSFGPRPSYKIATADIMNCNKEPKTWDAITWNAGGFPSESGIATMSDFEKLYRTEHVQQGFGVLYADGATTTQMKADDVYGYCRHDDPEVRDKRGMCGVFVYYWNQSAHSPYNCRSIFLPVGRSGYGHRRSVDDRGTGTLRYSCGRCELFAPSLMPWMPLFYDLYMRKGAIYYARSLAAATEITGAAASDAIGLDMNFFTFDVNLITKANVKNGADACFLRRVGAQSRPSKSVRKTRGI